MLIDNNLSNHQLFMKKIFTYKKIAAYTLGTFAILMVFGGFIQPRTTHAQWVDNCDSLANPNPGPSDTGYQWTFLGNGGANTTDADGSCSWTGGTCNASNLGNLGRFEDVTVGPGSTSNWSGYRCDLIVTPGPTASLTASTLNVTIGNSASLDWSSSNATSCANNWSTNTATSGVEQVSPSVDTTYTVICSGPGGTSIPASVRITVTTPTSCVATIGSNVATVSTNPGIVRLNWDSTCAYNEIRFAPGTPESPVANRGSRNVNASFALPTNYVDYYIYGSDCNTCGVKQINSVRITYIPSPIPPSTIDVVENVPGGTCTLNPGGGGVGSNTVNPNPGGTTYILTCTTFPPSCTSANVTNSQGGGSAMTVFPGSSEEFTITYNCIPSGVPTTVDLKADAGAGFVDGPITITSGQSINLEWNVTGSLTSCNATGGNAGWAGPKNASGGTQNSGPITTSATFSMQCANGAGATLIDDVDVIVSGVPNPAPILSSTPGACSSGSISLAWSSSLGATSYVLSRDGTQIYNGPALSHSDTGLAPGSSHTYRVFASNGSGNSAISTVIETAPPVCPVGSATFNVTSNEPTATWSLDNGGGSGTGSQSIAVTPAPGGTTYILTPQTIPGMTATVTPAPLPPVNAGDTVNVTISYVLNGGPFTYSLSANPITVTQGQTGQTIVAISGPSVAETVGINIGSLPPGVSVNFPGSPCTPNCNAFINFIVANSVTPRTYTITVNGLSSGTNVARSDTFTLTVIPSSTLSVSCTAVPNPAQVGQLVTWTASVAGNIHPVTYLWSGDNVPAGITSPSLSLRYLTTGPKNASVRVTEAVTGDTAVCPSVYIPVNAKPTYKEF